MEYFLQIIMKAAFIAILYLFVWLIIKSISSGMFNENKKKFVLILKNKNELLDFFVSKRYIIDGTKTIGRDEQCDISIKDPFISKKHLIIQIEDGKCYLEDLESKNGTKINQKSITPGIKYEVKPGDLISFGRMHFILQNQGDE